MKRLICLFLAVCTAVGVCACSPDANTSSEEIVSSDIVSEVSSEDTSSEDLTPLLWKEIDGKLYYDIGIAAQIYPPNGGDRSSLFIEEAEGYYIESGLYYIDAETMLRVVKKPFKGNGAITWLGYKIGSYGLNNFDGILPVSRMDDPLYVLTCLPNEQSTYMQTNIGTKNASIMYPVEKEHVNVLTIGAIYLNDELDIPDDTTFTICLGRITCAIKTTDNPEWQLVRDDKTPNNPGTLYFLPWGTGTKRLDFKKIKKVGDHYEITLTAKDLKATDNSDSRVKGACLHFWGTYHNFKDSTKVEGIAGSYVVWIKESQYSGYLSATIGADLRNAKSEIKQAYSGINYTVTSKPRVVYGHNVPTDRYDEIMDTKTVQKMLGIK